MYQNCPPARRPITSILLTIGLLAIAATAVAAAVANRLSLYEQLDLIVDVRHTLMKNYVEQPNDKKMVEAAVRGMVDSLDDPYTIYLSPEELEPFDQAIHGTFTGIGAEVESSDGHIRIITPLDDSPAWKAGVLAGDIVLEIAGKPTEGMTLTDAVKQMKGPEGSPVTIKVRHPNGEEATIRIIRAQINVQTVKGARRTADGTWDFMLDKDHAIGYIRISQFTEDTEHNVRAAVAKLKDAGVKGLILDLRNNPGGLLDSAVNISSLFLDGKKRIVSVKGRVVAETVKYSNPTADLPDVPMVVLANESSASAAEVVTGALSDNNRAKFVGTRTFGKGSVQQVISLDTGEGALKITNAYYYLPNGRNIHRRKDKDVWGVDPDDGCYVPMSADQILEMARIRQQGDILDKKRMDPSAPSVTPDWIEKDLADPQLAAGLRAVLGKQKTGNWPVVGKSNAQALAMETRKAELVRQRDLITDRLQEVQKELNKLDASTTQPATHEAAAPSTQPANHANAAPKPDAPAPTPSPERELEPAHP